MVTLPAVALCVPRIASTALTSAGTRAADGIVEVIGHLQGLAETRRLGQPWPQQMETHGKTAATITLGVRA